LIHIVQYVGKTSEHPTNKSMFAKGAKFLMVDNGCSIIVADAEGKLHHKCSRDDFTIID